MSKNFFAGGPPVLRTRISISPWVSTNFKTESISDVSKSLLDVAVTSNPKSFNEFEIPAPIPLDPATTVAFFIPFPLFDCSYQT